jgi:predicted nucleotidyltransferase
MLENRGETASKQNAYNTNLHPLERNSGDKAMHTLEDIRKIAVPIARKYGVGKMAVFGSYARGEQTEKSDLDFVVDKGKIRGLQFYGFIDALENALNKSVDVLTYEQLPDTLFMDDVLKEQVVIYG